MGRTAQYAGIAAAVAVLLAILLPLLIGVNQFRPMLEAELSKTLGRSVKIGSLKLAVFSGGISANHFSIAEDPLYGSGSFVSAKSMNIRVDLRRFLRTHRIVVTAITVEQPEIALVQSLSGDWNFSKLAQSLSLTPSAPPRPRVELSIKLMTAAGARVSVKLSGCSNAVKLKQADLELRDFSSTAIFPFSLTGSVAGGGEIKVDGKAGPLDRTDLALTAMNADLKLSRFDLTGSGFTGPGSGIAGLVSFEGSAGSNGRSLQIAGKLTAAQLKLARNGSPALRPVQVDLSLGHDLKTRIGALSRGDIHIGSAQAGITGTYVIRGDTTSLNMNFHGPNMPVPDVAAMLPAVGIVLPAGASFQGGAAGARLAVEGPADRWVATGALAIKRTTLAGFDLALKMSPVVRLTGIQTGSATTIESLAANVRIAPEGITATNIQIAVPAIGAITGAGTIGAGHALNFAMRAKIQATGGVLGVLGPLGRLANVSFFIHGTASDPIFEPDINATANEKIQTIEDMGRQAMKQAADILGGLMDQVLPK